MRYRPCVLAALASAAAVHAQQPAAPPASPPAPPAAAPAPFTRQEVMIPVRDGVHLQTVILTPTGRTGPLPILLDRTPYGVPEAAPAAVPPSLRELAADGYIFVFQNLRGRFKSEGHFSLGTDAAAAAPGGTDETTDAYDTVDWLVKHVPNNNGRAGMFGVSYDGLTTALALLGPHPALKAVSEQATPVDQWMNDDMHRYGALRESYAVEYAVLEESDKNANTNFAFDVYDTYAWYLALGPLSNVNARYLHGRIPYWNEMVAHPDYDAFWQRSAWTRRLRGSTVPNLNVAGFWDQEDPWGPWQVFRRAAQHDPGHTNFIVAGPWYHGGWRAPKGDSLGAIALGGHETAREYRETIEAPFFRYYLHGQGEKPAWQATTFQTGSNRWRTYAAWPPPAATATNLYCHADGTLSFDAPHATAGGASYREYVSDPENPVPYRQRPISPTYPEGDWRRWEVADQRFVDNRPDVLTFVSAPLDHDLTVTGEVAADLFASTSGTDADFVVKLIDVYPENAERPAAAPAPGQYAHSVNGYELPIAMEVRRGRYGPDAEHANYDHPRPLTADAPAEWKIPLRDRDHVFLAGHRLMLQVQSTWFPLIDRNPQTFVPSIYGAAAADFVKATQRVYCAPDRASHVVLPVVR
ncbi:glutaryl-7-ACA acylase [Gemmatimonadetes bacterium T265]|nr:glutaryl-7-ACA acylase [Gemmatimonadetes bacterium T265]